MNIPAWIIFNWLGLIFMPTILLSQGIENILRYKTIEEIKARVVELERENKKNSGVIYLKAVVESDAKKAIALYEQLLLQFPQSAYADDAKFKISQYYFSLGFYKLAYEQFRELVWQYPNSPLQDDAAYYAAQCLAAMEQTEKAVMELNSFQQKYSTSSLVPLAREDLKKLTNGTHFQPDRKRARTPPPFTGQATSDFSSAIPTPTSSSVGHDQKNSPRAFYSVQVGAFLDADNARRQKEYFQNAGYDAHIHRKQIGGKKLHIVCLNSFTSMDDADQFGKIIYQKYRVKYQVVQLDSK